MNRLDSEDSLIAPHEVRELLARLTDQTIESIGPQETRTVAGLALQTGVPVDTLRRALADLRGRNTPSVIGVRVVVALACVALTVLLARRMREPVPQPQAQLPPVQVPRPAPAVRPQINLSGLVPLNEVPYGPVAGNAEAEPTFHPSKVLPDGLSISATVEPVFWGAGDASTSAIQSPLSNRQLAELRVDLKELLHHVRQRAARRGFPSGPVELYQPGLGFDGPAFRVDLQIQSYAWPVNEELALPIPDPKYDAAANDIIRTATDLAIKQLEDQIKQEAERKRASGP